MRGGDNPLLLWWEQERLGPRSRAAEASARCPEALTALPARGLPGAWERLQGADGSCRAYISVFTW